ncbi:MAG: T9SS type A sorting domain-containing protein, partial [Bacteroidia bacterium]|nr:T9SS type A sorting domain-containing protein [Bacteroidia bacterium]
NNDSVFQLIDPYNGDGFYTQVNQQNPNIAYLAWQYGAIRKATNALVNYPTFTSCLNEMDANASGGIDDGGWTVNPFSMNMLDGNQLYIATLKRVWRTVNSATNWTPLTNILNGDGNSPYCVGISNALNPTVYIGGQQLKFYRVDNAATAVPGSEVNIRASAPSIIKTSFISNIVVHPNNDSIVYVSLSSLSTNPRLWKVTGAKTNNPVWTSISGDLPSGLPVNWIEVDPSQPDKVFIVATDYGLYTTVNGGVNWSHEMAIPDAPIPMVKVRASDRKLFIFTHGRSVWVADLPSITTSVAEHLSAKSGLVIFPNPATHNLNFNLTGSSSVEIFDQAGKLLLRKQVENVVDLENIPTGVYFIKLENNGTAYRKRFVKF